MRILHVIASLDPAQGGPPVVAENLARAQAALGQDVRLAAEDAAGDTALLRHSFRDVFRSPRPEVSALVGSADLLHLHGVWEPVLLSAARAARRFRIPYVVTPHGMLDPWSLSQKKWKKRLALALGYRRMLDSAAALHVLNQDEKELLIPLALRAPSEVIPNGISLTELDAPPDTSAFRRRLPRGHECRYILFLSRLHFKKGLDHLADAFAMIANKHADVDLVVAGPDGGEEQPFRRRVGELKMTGRVHLTGPLYGPDKWSAIAGAACFCLPSRQEGFSMAILEALACRVPVVISEACHFPEVAAAKAGYLVPLLPEKLAEALDRVLSDPAAAASMGQAGRRLVEARYTWPKVAAASVELYERLARPMVAT